MALRRRRCQFIGFLIQRRSDRSCGRMGKNLCELYISGPASRAS